MNNNQQHNINARFLLSMQANSLNAFTLDIDTTLPAKGITAIFGHSGSGKTSLLRCIAGLEKPQQGKLSVSGRCWQDQQVFTPSHQRPIGYVFQDGGLFPHLTVAGNLQYALKRSPKPDNLQLFDEVVELMGIGALLKRQPQQLSGGEQQRTAIARALLIQPQLLLMDEPMSSLDMQRKQEIMPYLEQLKQSVNYPILYVSHSLDEVARLADHILVLEHGRLLQQGSLQEVFANIHLPSSLGEDAGVVIEGEIKSRDDQWHLANIAFNGGLLQAKDSGEPVGKNVRLRILAKDVSLTLSESQDSSILNRIPATITEIIADHQKAAALIKLKTGHEYLVAQITLKSLHELQLKTDMPVWTQIKSVAIVR